MRMHQGLGKVLCCVLISVIFSILPASPVMSGTEPATVKRVVDGDTLKIIYQGQEESVRLIGIDTPESKRNKKARKDAGRSGKDVDQITAMGKEAARYMRTIAREGDRVNIEFDVQKRDKYKISIVYGHFEI